MLEGGPQESSVSAAEIDAEIGVHVEAEAGVQISAVIGHKGRTTAAPRAPVALSHGASRLPVRKLLWQVAVKNISDLLPTTQGGGAAHELERVRATARLPIALRSAPSFVLRGGRAAQPPVSQTQPSCQDGQSGPAPARHKVPLLLHSTASTFAEHARHCPADLRGLGLLEQGFGKWPEAVALQPTAAKMVVARLPSHHHATKTHSSVLLTRIGFHRATLSTGWPLPSTYGSLQPSESRESTAKRASTRRPSSTERVA